MGLDCVELVMQAEDFFGVSIPDEKVTRFDTAGDLHRLLMSVLNEPVDGGKPKRRDGRPWTEDAVWGRIVEMLQPLRPGHPITPETRFVEDLGMSC
jgi:acyl carrier protein